MTTDTLESISAADVSTQIEQLPTFLTTEEVAGLLRVNRSTVCRWRLTGNGPRVTWLSTKIPRYQKSDVLSWVHELVG